jgi:hypothetical protein
MMMLILNKKFWVLKGKHEGVDLGCYYLAVFSMGIKSIKSIENNLQPDPIFELEGMIKVRK